jgi:hypothetical protein
MHSCPYIIVVCIDVKGDLVVNQHLMARTRQHAMK